MNIQKNYLPSVDGLRCLAVLGVIVFHLDKSWLPGGFLGVDVFFVISGFLITRILIVDMGEGSFSLLRFYQRRIARIFPAFFLVIVFTMIVGSLVYDNQDRASLGANSLAASVSLINVKLMMQGSYFDISEDAQPLLHFWSLAVEEQFYLLYPLVLLLLFRSSFRAHVVFVIALMSFVFCVWLSFENANWAFYMLPSRAWELLLGGVIAFLPGLLRTVSISLTNFIALSGVVAVVLSFALIDRGQLIPGYITAVPVIGAAMVVVATNRQESFVSQMFAFAPFVWVGKISYSLYLWHWPIFSFIDYRFLEMELLSRVALKLIVTFAFAYFTFKLLEKPVRGWLVAPKRKIVAFSLFFVIVGCAGTAGFKIWSGNYQVATSASVVNGGRIFERSGEARVALIGDSISAQYADTVIDITNKMNADLYVMAVPGRNFLPGEQSTLWNDVVKANTEQTPDVVIVANASRKIQNNSESVEKMLQAFDSSRQEVIVILSGPRLPKNVSRKKFRDGFRGPVFEDPVDTTQRTKAQEIVNQKILNGQKVLDASRFVTNSDGSIQFVGSGGRTNYQDRDHFAQTGINTHAKELCLMLKDSIVEGGRHQVPSNACD